MSINDEMARQTNEANANRLIDSLRDRVAELEAERTKLQGVYELALIRLADIATATGLVWDDPEGLAGHIENVIGERDTLRKVMLTQAERLEGIEPCFASQQEDQDCQAAEEATDIARTLREAAEKSWEEQRW